MRGPTWATRCLWPQEVQGDGWLGPTPLLVCAGCGLALLIPEAGEGEAMAIARGVSPRHHSIAGRNPSPVFHLASLGQLPSLAPYPSFPLLGY